MKACIQGKISWVMFGAMAAALLIGCTSTYQARSTKKSGFLQDYSQLKPGQDDRALLFYINPQAKLKTYNKIMLEPVKAYVSKGSAMSKLPKEDMQRLLNYLDSTLREHLKADYAIVNQPAPDVMRLRVAITEAKGSRVILDTISTVIPYSLAVSEIKRIATGSHLSVGSARVECEALDSVSNVRLFAAVDERVGRKITGKFDKFDKWHTAHDAFDYWAERLQTRLREERNPPAAK